MSNDRTYNCKKYHILEVVLVSNNNMYIDIKPYFFNIEISGHEMFPRYAFQTLSQVLVVSRNVNKYGVSALAISER